MIKGGGTQIQVTPIIKGGGTQCRVMPTFCACVLVGGVSFTLGFVTYVTRHEKIGLMCTQNLTTFLNFKLQ